LEDAGALISASPLGEEPLMKGVKAARIASLLSGYFVDRDVSNTGTLSKNEDATFAQFETLLASSSSYRVTRAASKDSTLLPPDTALETGAAETTGAGTGAGTAALASATFFTGVAAFTGLALPLAGGDPPDTEEEAEAEAEADNEVAPDPTPKPPNTEEALVLKPPNVAVLRPPVADLPKPLPDEPNTDPVVLGAADLVSEEVFPNDV
jgi:hypothetical protein